MAQRKLHPAPQTEDRYHEILAASLQLFAKFGYEKTSIDRIAHEVNATKGLIYYYFRTKEDILRAMLQAFDFSNAIGAIGQIDSATPLAEALGLLIAGSLSVLDAQAEYIRFLYTEGQFISRETQSQLKQVLDVWTAAVDEFLAARIARGELRPHDTYLSAHQLTDAVLAYFLKTRVLNRPMAKKIRGVDYFSAWIDMFLNGLAPAKA